MDNWIAYLIIGIALVLIIGNFSTFQKSTHHKMRKQNLNDREETLPRTHRTDHKMPTIKSDNKE
ncbi:DUF2897 family protein [Colwellia sp. MSW7]|jgi:hypothetical protein|uniref:DUF2897 family protein n=1 Tax=Colwellia maritima TaxID=2912588 RepID=A0ABS9X1I6_9GAMM|nr:DUF2897 family protein [Colwellia maritima]MCI2284105.1 DUF2897 family protein [Colwellia maritima]